MIDPLSKFLRRCLAALGLATAASCTTAAPPAPVAVANTAPRPALWQVSDQDTTIYLFGTIHLLPKDSQWRTPALDSAIGSSQSLVLETIIDDKNPAELAGAMASLGFRNDLPPLADRIDPSKRPLLEAAIRKTGIPRAVFDRMETWAAAFSLIGLQFRSIGLEGGEGVEAVLRSSFQGAGKTIGQLETNREQLGFFDTLPESAQRALLEGAIETPGDIRQHFQGMLSAWLRGDVEAIAKTFNEDLSASPELMEALIRRRNANWSKWIEGRMAQPGTVMVAVGAGHLAGKGSVQDFLRGRGMKIRRIQ
ncbi:MAG TPA: TraB/GumN family protein [Sphingomicrobium sp.]|nr:TraB/GumN family protein [Sphingomicrobium sp.]